MNTETTSKRTPTALHFDRTAIAYEIQKLENAIQQSEFELSKLREDLAVQYRKLNQLSLIAVGRLRKS